MTCPSLLIVQLQATIRVLFTSQEVHLRSSDQFQSAYTLQIRKVSVLGDLKNGCFRYPSRTWPRGCG